MNGKPNIRVLQNKIFAWKISVFLQQSQKETYPPLEFVTIWHGILSTSGDVKPITIIDHTALLFKFMTNKQTFSFTSFRTVQYFLIQCCKTYVFCLHSNNKTSLNCALCSLYVWKCMLLCWYFAASSLSNNLMQFGRNWYHVRNE